MNGLSGVSAIGAAPPPAAVRPAPTLVAADHAPLDGIPDGALRVEGLLPGHGLRHLRSAALGFAVDEITVERRARVGAAPLAGVMIGTLLDGAARLPGGFAVQPGRPVLAHPDRDWSLQVDHGTVQVLTLEPWLLQRTADEYLPRRGDPLRMLEPTPATPALTEAWTRSVNYVVETLAVGSPRPVVDASGRVLAAAVLSCFAPTDSANVPAVHDPDLPISLRRALFFIAENARDEIGVQEIAGAVHLSPRAVQYLFRKHLDETPTEHLRRVRLQRAHLDLAAAHRGTTTVSEVARRWGFSHTGRFAVLYRETYGVSPHVTLRG
ncbi:helix-turn-helix transcriptional regulator [Mycolicibacterium cosmeticum]|uniref:helix-turn-helix transcriptional regulator n=1 Tax=Mycolicibacterium cosmeticum TaxID=258533 RepID=UPI000AB1D6B9|nr:helix-turn-helix transcriptional regulator [Mycolicibacterium cosmeticum]